MSPTLRSSPHPTPTHWAVRPPQERGVGDPQQPPKYDYKGMRLGQVHRPALDFLADRQFEQHPAGRGRADVHPPEPRTHLDHLVTARSGGLHLRQMQRQQILSRSCPPQFIAVIDESILRRPILGRYDVMREQLDHLAACAERPQIHVHVVPTEAGVHAGLAGPFILAGYAEGGWVAHLDTPLRAQVLDRAEDIANLHRRWESIRGEALSRRQSIALIQEVAKTWS